MSGRLDAIESNLIELLSKVNSFSSSVYHVQEAASRNLQTTSLYFGPLNTGDTAFMIISTAIVLMMTIPGLGLYYAGMVSVKNVLACVMQSFSITCLVTFLFMCCGYSLAFCPPINQGSSEFIGNGSRLWYWGLGADSASQLATTIPESVYATYQLTFAIITAALIMGSFADRIKFSSMLIFIGMS